MSVETLPLPASHWRFALIASEFNAELVGQMVQGAKIVLAEHGVGDEQIDICPAPGAFELPLIAQKLADTGHYDAVIAFGIVIRGETSHFDFISSACAHGLTQVGLETEVPVLFGVLTTENYEQAVVRADPNQKNKGGEVALAAVQMVRLLESIPTDSL